MIHSLRVDSALDNGSCQGPYLQEALAVCSLQTRRSQRLTPGVWTCAGHCLPDVSLPSSENPSLNSQQPLEPGIPAYHVRNFASFLRKGHRNTPDGALDWERERLGSQNSECLKIKLACLHNCPAYPSKTIRTKDESGFRFDPELTPDHVSFYESTAMAL